MILRFSVGHAGRHHTIYREFKRGIRHGVSCGHSRKLEKNQGLAEVQIKKEPLIRQAGSAVEAFAGSATTGRDQFSLYTVFKMRQYNFCVVYSAYSIQV